MTDDEINALSAYWYALDKDTPARRWFHLPFNHPNVAKALGIDGTEELANYALAPFRYAKVEGNPSILAAWPCPAMFEPIDQDWLGIEHVIAWNPKTDHVQIIGDTTPQLIGSFREDNTIYSSARAFFQSWAQKRAAYAMARVTAQSNKWAAHPVELDEAPGCLIVGDPDAIRWNAYEMPQNLECVGIDARTINRAILRSANLPRAFQRAA